jgi:ADP-ribose pyrophosphatase
MDFELPNGKQATYSLTAGAPTVGILALTKLRSIVLARQFRPGPNAVFDELPGGSIDQGETPEQAALRELAEETGFTPTRLLHRALGIFGARMREHGKPEAG